MISKISLFTDHRKEYNKERYKKNKEKYANQYAKMTPEQKQNNKQHQKGLYRIKSLSLDEALHFYGYFEEVKQ